MVGYILDLDHFRLPTQNSLKRLKTCLQRSRNLHSFKFFVETFFEKMNSAIEKSQIEISVCNIIFRSLAKQKISFLVGFVDQKPDKALGIECFCRFQIIWYFRPRFEAYLL